MEDKDLEKDLENQEKSEDIDATFSMENEDIQENGKGKEKSAQDKPENDKTEEDSQRKESETEKNQEEDKAEKTGKSFFKRDKKEKKDSKDAKIQDLNERLVRNMAEFENFRKRNEKEKSQMFEIGAKSIIEKILPVIDNFERGLGTVSEEEKEDGFVQGMEKVYKQLLSTLEEVGVKPIEAVGQEFDPDFHNAVMHGEDPEQGSNLIVEEFQKGYMYKDSVVRYSLVKVVN